MNPEELAKAGSNQSLVHSDFMFGNEDMHIEGTLQDGTTVTIFDKGNYIV